MLKGDVAGHEFHGNQWGDVSGGEKLSTSDKARLAALHVPPAWTDVRLNKDPSAGLQAIGKDSKGRSQYLYSAAHSEAAAAEKWARISDFHKVEPGLTKQAFKDMNNTNLSQKERDTAATVALVSQTGFRIGSDRDTGADVKAFGASNLLGSQVEVNGNKVSFNFTGKKGVGQEHSINNADLAKYIKGRQAKVGDGRLFHSSAGGDAANAYIHSATGGKDFSIKDYRTHIATSTALDAVNKMSAPRTNAEYKTSRNAVGDIVAKQLGNTRGMALNSYIHPAAFSGWGFRK